VAKHTYIPLSLSTQAFLTLEILGVEEAITSFLEEFPPKELSSSWFLLSSGNLSGIDSVAFPLLHPNDRFVVSFPSDDRVYPWF
jgi:hypothetical protein